MLHIIFFSKWLSHCFDWTILIRKSGWGGGLVALQFLLLKNATRFKKKFFIHVFASNKHTYLRN